MRVLVTWGSKRGGTEGIGRIVGEVLADRGHEVTCVPVEDGPDPAGFDAAVVGGALHVNRWPPSVRRWVKRHVDSLRRIPVWMFSSGPLDDTADREEIPATEQVSVLAERVGVRGHVTFGGRLEPDAKGFPASAMAKTMSGDWRNPERIRGWAGAVADALPSARPGLAVDHPAASAPRLVAHGLIGWSLCAATMGLLMQLTTITAALFLHAIAAPVFFALLAWHYFGAHGARDPLPTAVAWTALVAGLDLVVVAGLWQGSLEMFAGLAGTWLPFALIFLATWATGTVMSMRPRPAVGAPGEPPRRSPRRRRARA